jgi:cobalt-zinc-cadmium efflux system membrane fusion protein
MKSAIWLVAVVALVGAGCGEKGGRSAKEAGAPGKEGGAAAKADGHGREERGKEAGHAEHEGHGEHDDEHGHGGEGHEGEGGEVVELAPEAVRNARIETVEAASRALATTLTAPARIAFSQNGVARVSPRVPGMLDQISVKLGQPVKKGAVLGWIESPELGRARADFLAAATRARAAEENHRREKDLLAKGITSEREMREAETAAAAARGDLIAAEARLHTLGLTDDDLKALRLEDHPSARFPARSPIAGTVVEIAGTIGQTVESTTHLFTVGDLSVLWVVLDLSESQLPHVAVGQKVDVTVEAIPGRRFQGRIEHVGDVVEVETRTIEVRVAVPNPDRNLKPGMFATAEVSAPSRAGAGAPGRVVVPRESVQKLGDAHVVFVSLGENRFKPVKVVTGADSGKEIEILDGLEAGATVVARGAFVLKSQLSKASMSGGHAGHGH